MLKLHMYFSFHSTCAIFTWICFFRVINFFKMLNLNSFYNKVHIYLVTVSVVRFHLPIDMNRLISIDRNSEIRYSGSLTIDSKKCLLFLCILFDSCAHKETVWQKLLIVSFVFILLVSSFDFIAQLGVGIFQTK